MGNEASTAEPISGDAGAHIHHAYDSVAAPAAPSQPASSRDGGTTAKIRERTQAVKGIIQKRNQEISYLIHVATQEYGNVKDIVGDEVWHFTVDSEEVQELLQIVERSTAAPSLEDGSIKMLYEDLQSYESGLAKCEQVRSFLRLAIDDYKRLADTKAGMEMTRYSYTSCRIIQGELHLTSTHLVWKQEDTDVSYKCAFNAKKSWPWTSMTSVILGVVTNPLKYNKVTGNRHIAPVKTPWLCFSVLCEDRTLDFSVESQESLILWVRSISCMIEFKGKDRDYKVMSEADIKDRLVSLKSTYW
jgi:hypothetical protein